MKLNPIRIPAGWIVQWNIWYDDDHNSQDLLWLNQIDVNSYKTSGIFIDVGWYQDTYKAVLADNWDDEPFTEIISADASEVIEAIEEWMLNYHKYIIERQDKDGNIIRRAKTWRDNPVPRFYNPLEDNDLL